MYKNILVPFDGSSTSLLGLKEAVTLGKALGSAVRIVHVVNELLMDLDYVSAHYHQELVDSLRKSGRATLEKGQAIAREHGVEAQVVMLETSAGRVADLILKQATAWPADVIVMGTHGRRGVRRMLMGSDAELVVRAAPVPVLLVREPIESD